jgi:signal transduction histidine kinase
MIKSLRARLTLSFLAVIVATVLLVVLIANVITRERFTYFVSEGGQRMAQRLAPIFARYYGRQGGWSGIQEILGRLEEQSDAPRGRRFGEGAMPMPISLRDDRVLLLSPAGEIIADSDPDAGGVRLPADSTVRGAAVLVNGEHVGTVVVVSGLGLLNRFQATFLRQVTGLLLLAGVLIAVVGYVVSEVQARRIVAPVKALSEAAHRVATGDFSQRVPVTAEDELGEMAGAFNTMADELERQRALRHRTMSDIAHELRTPLSVLQIELESLEDGIIEPTPQAIAGLQAEVVHLGRLVDDLRVLALTDAGDLRLERRPLDLGAWIREVVDRACPQAQEKSLTLDVTVDDGLVVAGDAQRLAQVLLNLLTNAIRHTPPGGEITIAAHRTKAGEARVEVADTGEGIPAEHLPHVFERFYQVDPARSSRGTGLGLSIARSLVEAHGGRIWAESEPGAGSTFVFTLPLVEGDVPVS